MLQGYKFRFKVVSLIVNNNNVKINLIHIEKIYNSSINISFSQRNSERDK